MAEEFVEDILAEEPSKEIKKPSEDIIDNKDNKTDIDLENKDDVKTDVELKTEQKVTTDNEKIEPKEVTIEDLATQIGWNPNYKGEDAIDAATFILKSREIQDTMKENSKELKNQLSTMLGSIEALKEHNEKVYKAEVKRMQAEIDSLKKQKDAAVELADVKKVKEIDKKIDDLQKDLNEPKIKETTSSNPVFNEWVKDNQWYLTNDEMATYAETVAKQYEGAPLKRVYELVRQRVAEVFPEKFETEKKTIKKEKPIGPTSPVETQTNKNKSNLTFTKADLTPEQINIMNQFVKTGVMTEEQYIKDIAKMQEG